MNAAEIVEILREKAIKHPIGRWADETTIEKSVLSEAADLIEQLEMDLEVTRMNLEDTRAELNRVEDDLRGAPDEAHRLMRKLNEPEELELYTKEYGDGRKEYRYGPEWVSMQLFMEGGYPTPEEAKAAWLREQGRRK